MQSRRAALQLAIAAALAPRAAHAQSAPAVAAAADLADALPVVAAAFHKRTGKSVRLVFGPSAALANQIQKGGTAYELLLASDESYVQRLERAGRTANSGALYGIGRIGLFLPKGSKIRADGRLRDLGAAAKDGRLQRLAILNPSGGPYGLAAKEALTRARVWMNVRGKLTLGETLGQTTQHITSGGVQAAIIPMTLARTPRIETAGTFSLIPAEWHHPLRQRAVLLKDGSQTAEAFYRFLRDPEARAAFRRYGFVLPGGR
ncbi:molybdate ABC transporter substrate-binding protein [Phenylobacterium sp.]|uniref:molybdate ABC transporter substrate-binding protein n=1 Tax=Phenylobacterium sp. TaxID=1871053 RepID=UPI002C7250AC|nr:molybdate ABC transporter substrate-binding protein [Phenylobacterium sp.]HVI33387.1 molybdate ABC transporter substrate-binding protein [Phenylobacterium sp.]